MVLVETLKKNLEKGQIQRKQTWRNMLSMGISLHSLRPPSFPGSLTPLGVARAPTRRCLFDPMCWGWFVIRAGGR